MVEKKERLDYFDIFKFILIVSVVAGHSEIPYWLKTLIFSIHMPAFIIVNGYFMKPSGICEHMAKTGRSLIPVYFITVAALNLSQFICSCRIGTGLGLPFVSVLDCQYTIPNILAAASGTFGILIILRISAPKNHMKLYSVLLFIGRNTLAVLCWHTIYDYIINVFYHKEIMAYLPVTEPVFIVLRIIFNMIPIIIIYIMEHCKIIVRKGYG